MDNKKNYYYIKVHIRILWELKVQQSILIICKKPQRQKHKKENIAFYNTIPVSYTHLTLPTKLEV